MKKYLAGLLTGLLSVVVITTALAATDLVSFNLSPIAFNGEVISAAGEWYTLSNGCVAPASITYTDEQGGGTTYLPARRVSELMGVDIGWDPVTGAVTIGKAEQSVAPDTTNIPDYSDWSAEDEAAYQEFKGMWEIRDAVEKYHELPEETDCYICVYHGTESVEWLKNQIREAKENGFETRLASDLSHNFSRVAFQYYHENVYIDYYDSSLG